tara:strand:- start:258 stop:716 length:459 start_codon:yes stop_codon:yes gene_type:complete
MTSHRSIQDSSVLTIFQSKQILCVAFSLLIFGLVSCNSKQINSSDTTPPIVQEKYSNSFEELSSLIDRSEKRLTENFQRKKVLMYRSQKYENLFHRRVDLEIRRKIDEGFEDRLFNLEQKNILLSRCGELYTLWEKQRKQLTIKRFQLGFNH